MSKRHFVDKDIWCNHYSLCIINRNKQNLTRLGKTNCFVLHKSSTSNDNLPWPGHWHRIAYTTTHAARYSQFARCASNATPPLPSTHFVRTADAVIDQTAKQKRCETQGYHIWKQIVSRQQVDKSCLSQSEFESEYPTENHLMKKEIHTVEHAIHHLLPRQFFSLLLSLV